MVKLEYMLLEPIHTELIDYITGLVASDLLQDYITGLVTSDLLQNNST